MNVIGYAISLLEEYSFLGFISSLVSMIGFHTSITELYNGLILHDSFTHVFFAYMFISLIAYPVLMIISVICEKTGILYDGQYSGNSVFYDVIFNFWNDLIFPVYTLKNRKYAPVSATIFSILWLAVVAFLVAGFIITY